MLGRFVKRVRETLGRAMGWFLGVEETPGHGPQKKGGAKDEKFAAKLANQMERLADVIRERADYSSPPPMAGFSWDALKAWGRGLVRYYVVRAAYDVLANLVSWAAGQIRDFGTSGGPGPQFA